jgi:hypothetical protein
MSDFRDSASYRFGFQIHHVIPSEVFGLGSLRSFLTSSAIGVQLDMKGNKIALPTNRGLVQFFAGDPTVREAAEKAGWGWTQHFGSHPGYNQFFRDQLNFIATGGKSPEQQKFAVFDLIRFGTDVSTGRIAGLDLSAGSAALTSAWSSRALDVTALTTDQSVKLNQFMSGFNTTLVDANSGPNTDFRYEKAAALANEMKTAGVLSADK